MDRTTRLINLWIILSQNPLPRALKVREIANSFKVDRRTIYRDRNALQNELRVPIGEEGPKRFLVEGHHLPPIRFSVQEAMTIFLAARLLLHYSRRYDPNIASTFLKLNSAVELPLRDQIQKTMDWLQKQELDKQFIRTMAILTEAWVNQRTVRIWYHALSDAEATERSIDPYFIEPAVAGHSSYVIGYCHRTNEMRTFKIERITAIEMTSETYDIPADFDANAYLASAWGIVADGEAKTIKLRFRPELARIMEETVWHPSQVLQPQRDGSMIVTFTVTDTIELYSWILSWGEKVEVLEPESLRQDIIDTARAMLKVYH